MSFRWKAVVGAVTFALLVLVARGAPPATAGPAAEGLIVGLDMDPIDNSCPNNGTDCALGTIERCMEVPSGGGVVNFDIFLEGLPRGENIAGWQARIGEQHDVALGPIITYVHKDANINLLAQPGSGPLLEFSSPTGTLVPSFSAAVVDFGAAEYNPPYTKGTLGRYAIDTTGVADGVYGLTLGNVVIAALDPVRDLCDTVGCGIKDAHDGYGIIAVGVACPVAGPIA